MPEREQAQKGEIMKGKPGSNVPMQPTIPKMPSNTSNALKALNSVNATQFNALDSISRQAAIKALDKRFDSIPMEQKTEILLLRRDLRELPPTQPELIEKEAYIRGFEQGRTQGMIDSQSGKR